MTMADPDGDPREPGGDDRIVGASTTEPFEGAGGPPAQPVSDEEARGVDGPHSTDPDEAAQR